MRERKRLSRRNTSSGKSRSGHSRWRSLGSVLVAVVAGLGFSPPAAVASEYADQWGPEVGSKIPFLEASDHTGKVRTLADLAGEQGLLLFLNRSADW